MARLDFWGSLPTSVCECVLMYEYTSVRMSVCVCVCVCVYARAISFSFHFASALHRMASRCLKIYHGFEFALAEGLDRAMTRMTLTLHFPEDTDFERKRLYAKASGGG